MKSAIDRASWSLSAASILFGCTSKDLTELLDRPGSPQPSPPNPSAEVLRLQSVWSNAVAQGVSAVALVRHRGEVLARFAAGQSRRDQALPNTLNTAFDIGSITKQFTGAAITHLYEQGQLDLDATLGDLFEDVPDEKAAISVHQLLTHTAGLPSALGYDDEPILREAYLERAWDWPLSADPGALHWYSNTGYSLLGAIIERVTGRAYDEYLGEALLEPAGLETTGYLGLDLDPSRVAVGYAGDDADDPLERPHAPDGYYWNLRANGGMLSTAADLERWSDALLGGEVLGPDALERYLTPHVREGLGSDASYAYGWSVSDTEVGRLITHDGGNDYFFANVQQYVDADLLVIVLSNAADDAAYALPIALAHAVLPELPSTDDQPEPPLVIDRQEEVEASTDSFVESVDFVAKQDRAVAGFFLDLESGSARYRVRAPDGKVFAEGQGSGGEPRERLFVIPPQLGRWQLEVDTTDATGSFLMAWSWD